MDQLVNNDRKIKILAWGDYCCSTGFATVLGNIMRELHKTGMYEIDVLAINYSGDPYDTHKWPGRVWPAMPGIMAGAPEYADVYGRQRLLDLMGSGDYDVVFMLQDTFIIHGMMSQILRTQEELRKHPKLKSFKTVYYYPIDATPKEKWITDVVKNMDFPVAYTEYAKRETLKFAPELAEKLAVMYHGTNLKHFFPVADKTEISKFRKEYFQGNADDKFLIVNVNRNQPRKDTARNLLVLKELLNRGRKVAMYMHMQYEDVGGNIFSMAAQLGLTDSNDFFVPSPKIFTANQGMPVETVNMIYNAADCVFTPTLGEGWGLSVTEAMATKTPVVAPANTSLNEMLADNRGMLVPSGNNPSMFTVQVNDNERIRPIMDVTAAADAIEAVMDGNGPDIEGAYKWATALSWERLCQDWIKIINRAANASKTENSQPVINQFMTRADRRRLERETKNKTS